MRTINRIDGKTFAEMMISGANLLYNNKQRVDDLNVFPVPDGDTGTNMSMTINAVAKELASEETQSLTKTADRVAFATLRGARGNSGVILSQFFRGISKTLKGAADCDGVLFAQALRAGADAAYKAVMNPTEGTILTVAREAAIGAEDAAAHTEDILEIFYALTKRGNDALAKTTQQLPALRQAGVVDAGGQGWMYVLEGALAYLEGNPVVGSVSATASQPSEGSAKPQAAVMQEIKFKYCTEFLIEKQETNADVTAFREAIAPKGDCMLVIDDETIVKVHIHTNHPGFVLEEAVKLGEMINLKIDNMKHQHNSLINEERDKKTTVTVQADVKPKKQTEPLKERGFAAVCAGKGLAEILTDLGVDRVIEGGQTMNPSTDDLLKAVGKIRAQNVFLFPNNKNIVMAANQAKEISGQNIIVIPTKNIPQCVAAMMAYNPAKDLAANEKAMNKAVGQVQAGQVTYAVRDTKIGDREIRKGDILGLIGSEIVAVGKSPEAVCHLLVEKMTAENENGEFITVYQGKAAKKAAAEKMTAELEEKYEDFEVSLRKGGQPLYYYLVSLE